MGDSKMLKLVVSNDFAAPEKPDDWLTHFHAGDVLENSDCSLRVLVVACGADCTTAMLMPLPDGELYEAQVDDMAGWEVAYLPGPRFVEVRRKSSKKIVWSSHVPDIDAAIALWQKLEWIKPTDFDVEIHAQHPTELEMLDDMGYFDKRLAERR
jgi:hypothetical protein